MLPHGGLSRVETCGMDLSAARMLSRPLDHAVRVWQSKCSCPHPDRSIGGAMPEKETLERARRDKAEGKSPSTQAGEFVREEIHHIREGKHGARSTKQAIAIGLSKARRAGVRIPAKGKSARKTRSAPRRGAKRSSAKRSRAALRKLKREPHRAASHKALSQFARSSARRRSASSRRASARKAARTRKRAGH